MSFRNEEKIPVANVDCLNFINKLKKNKIKKLYGDRKVNSIYFENSTSSIFRDSEEGNTPRKKIRIRNYPHNDNKNYYLETKFSSNEGRFKLSKKISNFQYAQLLQFGLYDNLYGLVKPSLVVSYKRSYFYIKGSRITIDTQITYNKFNNYKLHKEKLNVIEIKNKEINDTKHISYLINNPRFRFSKYCNAYKILLNLNMRP